jgi:uncharacterized protein (DUF111 family)
MRQVDTAWGPVRVKLKFPLSGEGGPIGATAEYDDCKGLAEKHNVAVRAVWEAASGAAQALLATLQRG